MNPPVVSRMHLSTRNLSMRDRIAVICDLYGRTILKHDIDPIGAAPFEFDADLYRLPGLGLGSTAIAPCRAPRGRRHIDGDDLVFTILRSGGRAVQQRGRECLAGEGEAILTSSADTGVVTVRQPSRLYSLRLPQNALRPRLTDFDVCLLRPVPRDCEALRLLTAYITAILGADIAETSATLAERIAAHVGDLVSLALGANRDAEEIARGRGLRAARLAAVDRLIAQNLGDGELSAAVVAARLGVTPRYVHLLLEETGRSFSHHVLERRLERAVALLRDPHRRRCKIAEIAAEVGFGDLSYFNRSFRRRFGATPSDIRHAAGDRPS